MGVKSIKVLSLLMLRHSFVKKKFLGKIVLKKKRGTNYISNYRTDFILYKNCKNSVTNFLKKKTSFLKIEY